MIRDECSECIIPIGTSQARVLHHLELAEAHLDKVQYGLVNLHLEVARQIIQDISDDDSSKHLLRAKVSFLQGHIHENTSQLDAAAEEYSNAAQQLSELPELPEAMELLAIALNKLGNIHQLQDRFDVAVDRFQLSITAALKVANFSIATTATNNMGNAYMAMGDIRKAVACYSSAFEYAKQAGPLALAQACTVLAWLHSNYGPMSMALDYADKAYALINQIENINHQALIVISVGAAYLKHGDLEKADQYLNEAYDMTQRSGNAAFKEMVLEELAQLAWQKGDDITGRELIQRAYDEASGTSLGKEAALHLIMNYILHRDYREAQNELQRMGSDFQPGARADALISQAAGLLAAGMGHWDEAKMHLQRILSSNMPAD